MQWSLTMLSIIRAQLSSSGSLKGSPHRMDRKVVSSFLHSTRANSARSSFLSYFDSQAETGQHCQYKRVEGNPPATAPDCVGLHDGADGKKT